MWGDQPTDGKTNQPAGDGFPGLERPPPKLPRRSPLSPQRPAPPVACWVEFFTHGNPRLLGGGTLSGVETWRGWLKPDGLVEGNTQV